MRFGNGVGAIMWQVERFARLGLRPCSCLVSRAHFERCKIQVAELHRFGATPAKPTESPPRGADEWLRMHTTAGQITIQPCANMVGDDVAFEFDNSWLAV